MEEPYRSGFDEAAFWHEVNPVLARGTREMLNHARDKDALISAYDKMDYALGELVGRFSPPAEVKDRLNGKIEDRIKVIGRILKANEIDASQHWDADMKRVSIVVLKSMGYEGIFRIDTVVEEAANALCQGNFTNEGAKKLLAELASSDAKSLRGLLMDLDDTPGHMDFLRLLSEKGTPAAKRAAGKAMCSALPAEKPIRLARVIEMPMVARSQQTLRH
ncbi:MAG: hypothetical protein AB1529_04560 [Candidatus Micrarchaeota archaeon]